MWRGAEGSGAKEREGGNKDFQRRAMGAVRGKGVERMGRPKAEVSLTVVLSAREARGMRMPSSPPPPPTNPHTSSPPHQSSPTYCPRTSPRLCLALRGPRFGPKTTRTRTPHAHRARTPRRHLRPLPLSHHAHHTRCRRSSLQRTQAFSRSLIVLDDVDGHARAERVHVVASVPGGVLREA